MIFCEKHFKNIAIFCMEFMRRGLDHTYKPGFNFRHLGFKISAPRTLSYTIYLETALLNIFGQKSVVENMADCDVKRVTVPYFFRMIADQKNSPKLFSPPVPTGPLPKFPMKFFKLRLTLFKTCLVLVPFFGARTLERVKEYLFPGKIS